MEVWLSADFPGVQNQGVQRIQHNQLLAMAAAVVPHPLGFEG